MKQEGLGFKRTRLQGCTSTRSARTARGGKRASAADREPPTYSGLVLRSLLLLLPLLFLVSLVRAEQDAAAALPGYQDLVVTVGEIFNMEFRGPKLGHKDRLLILDSAGASCPDGTSSQRLEHSFAVSCRWIDGFTGLRRLGLLNYCWLSGQVG